jgi:hypothetical protein
MRRIFYLAGLLLSAPASTVAGPPADVALPLKSWEGKAAWLRIDVIRVQYLLNGKDATNVLPDGHV